MAFVTESSRPQPLWQPPPTACLTACGVASEVPSVLLHPCWSPRASFPQVIEHVTDSDLFLQCIADLTSPGGAVIVTTMNKTALAYLLGVVVAEYVLGLAKPGTHDWHKFIAPEDVQAALARHGLVTHDTTGVVVLPDPCSGTLAFIPAPLTGVNYMLAASKA